MKGTGRTDRGIQRKNNQDCFDLKIDTENVTALCVVCDGMGGANAGNVASRLAVETFISELDGLLQEPKEEDAVCQLLHRAVTRANAEVYEQARRNEAYSGMGTTLVGAFLSAGQAVIVNVGDSRAYHVRGGAITRITKDHSVVEDMLIRGDITPEEARCHPNKNLITKAIGTEPEVAGDVYTLPIRCGDHILLCSDGLTNLASEEEILRELEGRTLEQCGEMLINLALSRGAPDNVTVVIMEI